MVLLGLNLNAKTITVAVAANVSYAIEELIKEFNVKNPNTKVNVTLGSSGKLTAQITHGAPYDLFMAANMKYPQSLYIEIFEKQPVAILFNKKEKFYLSDKSELIKFIEDPKFKDLPYVIGEPKKFKILYETLKKLDFPLNSVKKYILYESNRWDIEIKNNQIIKLPEVNYNDSLKNYLSLVNKNEFKKYKIFDFRINNQLILK